MELQGTDIDVDAIYLVAGGRDHGRRVDALCGYAETQADPVSQKFLIGRNEKLSRYNREMQRNLSYQEWAIFDIEKKFNKPGKEKVSVSIVPGVFTGTDGEMEALAGFLDGNSDIKSLAVVTSPFHFRRTINRLNEYLHNDIQILCVPASGKWYDRAPWTVLGEIAKMTRDALGWSRVPLLSREMQQHDS